MKIYQVMVIDIWNNITLVGFFKNLDDSVDPINDYIFEDKFKIKKGDLKEYASTFSMVFDTTVGDIYDNNHPNDKDDDVYNEEYYQLQIRGFILDSDDMINEIHALMDDKK